MYPVVKCFQRVVSASVFKGNAKDMSLLRIGVVYYLRLIDYLPPSNLIRGKIHQVWLIRHEAMYP